MAAHFKKAAGHAARIVVIDGTGLLMRPLVRRSLAPRGRPLVVGYQANHRQKVSVQAGLVLRADGSAEALRARLHADSYVDGAKTAEFLRSLLREFGDGPLIVLWDRGNMHKGPHVRQVLAEHPRLWVESFPPYCPDLDPVEWLWAWMKYGRLANLAPRDLRHLVSEVAKAIVAAQENQSLLDGFARAAGLVATEEPERALAA